MHLIGALMLQLRLGLICSFSICNQILRKMHKKLPKSDERRKHRHSGSIGVLA